MGTETYSDTDKVWLIKSSGALLGPYSAIEITQALKDRRIAIIDEIRSPTQRWIFLREHSKFRDIVIRLRSDDQSSNEKTHIGADLTRSMDSTVTMTEDLTPDLPKVKDGTVVIQGKERVLTGAGLGGYGAITDVRVQGRVKSSVGIWKSLLWTIVLVSTTVISVIVVREYRLKNKTLAKEDYLTLARGKKNLGLYTQAANFYQKANEVGGLDQEEKQELLPVLVAAENQTLAARRLIEELLQEQLTENEQLDLIYWRALAWSREGQYQAADADFSKLTDQRSQFKKVHLNIAINNLLRGDYHASLTALAKVPKTSATIRYAVLIKSLALLRIADSAQSKDLADVTSELSSFAKSKQQFLPETLLILTALYNQQGNKIEAELMAAKLLDQIPDATQFFVADLEINQDFLKWNRLGFLCDRLSSIEGSAVWRGMQGFCLYSKGDTASALQILDEAQRQYPQDLSLRGIHAYLLEKGGRWPEAKTLLSQHQATDLQLPEYLLALRCVEDKDLVCAEVSYKKILTKDPTNVWFQWIKARVHKERNEKELARSTVEKTLPYAENFRPLLELRDEISQR